MNSGWKKQGFHFYRGRTEPRKIVVTLLRDSRKLSFDKYRKLCLNETSRRRRTCNTVQRWIVRLLVVLIFFSSFFFFFGEHQKYMILTEKTVDFGCKGDRNNSALSAGKISEGFLRSVGLAMFLTITIKNNSWKLIDKLWMKIKSQNSF